jgi:AGCS family alanine or glycine:cation symporter
VLLLVTFGLGFNALQSYTVASSFGDAFGIPTVVTGIGLVIVLGLIIFGGISGSPPRPRSSCRSWRPATS